jgi:hypothetical protein
MGPRPGRKNLVAVTSTPRQHVGERRFGPTGLTPPDDGQASGPALAPDHISKGIHYRTLRGSAGRSTSGRPRTRREVGSAGLQLAYAREP